MAFPSKTGSSYKDSITVLILLPLSWVFVLIRIYVRGFITKQAGWDDITAVIAAAVYTFECASVLMINRVSSSASHSPGPPSQRDIILEFKWFMIAGIAYTASCFFVKLSLGLGYLRIVKFRHLDPRWERWVCYTVILASCVINLEGFFYILFGCAGHGFMPQDSASAIITGKCTSHGGLVSLYVQSTTNVIIDWILVLLPIPSVFGAIMDRRIRLSIIGILLLGACGSVASIIRLVYIPTFFSKNPESGTIGTIMSHVEIGTFVICGCLSTFHPLLAKYFSIGTEKFSTSRSLIA